MTGSDVRVAGNDLGDGRSRAGYRLDIEALRGVAVLAVLLYHFGFSFAGGGYVGVDIFFVISGFVITRYILNAQAKSGFKYKIFWVNRIRRLFPALVATVAGSFAAGTVLLTPSELSRIAQACAAALGSYSNIFFWLESGYFDDASRHKPLLHTWSLGVEAQFYLIWPLIILLLAAISSRARYGVLATLIAVSIFSSELFLYADPSASFFLLPFRVGEFCVGAVLCMLPAPRRSGICDISWLIGVAIILMVVAIYARSDPFPGLRVVPVLAGTALVIRYGAVSRFRAAINNPVFGYLGRISYSVYLVHWPLFVFGVGLAEGSTVEPMEQAYLFVGSIIGGALLYLIVEQPLRVGTRIWPGPISNRGFARLAFWVIGPLILVLASAASTGWAWRLGNSQSLLILAKEIQEARKHYHATLNLNFPKQGQTLFDPVRHSQHTCSFDQARSSDVVKDCLEKQISEPVTLVIGDSHGRDMLHALRRAFPERRFAMMHQSGCLPATYTDSKIKQCFPELRTIVKDFVDRGLVENIVLGSRFQEEHVTVFLEKLPELLELSRRVLIFGPGPWLFKNPDRYLARHGVDSLLTFNTLLTSQIRPSVFRVSDELAQAAKKMQVSFVRKLDAFCSNGECLFVKEKSGTPLYWDDEHLTLAGIEYFSGWLHERADVRGFFDRNRQL